MRNAVSGNSVILPYVIYITNNRLGDVNLDCNKLHNIIETLDPNKAHEYDHISIRILKLWSSSIIATVLITQNCLNSGFLSEYWKKVKIVPHPKK